MTEFQIPQKESIELSISTKGVYTWSIKVLENEITEYTLQRLEKINLKMMKLYKPLPGINSEEVQ